MATFAFITAVVAVVLGNTPTTVVVLRLVLPCVPMLSGAVFELGVAGSVAVSGMRMRPETTSRITTTVIAVAIGTTMMAKRTSGMDEATIAVDVAEDKWGTLESEYA